MSAENVKHIFAVKLKKLREEVGLSQTQLAERLGVSRGSVSYYENSDRTAGIDFIYKVAEFFDCSTDYLLGLSEYKNEKAIQTESTSINKIDEIFNELPSAERESVAYTFEHLMKVFPLLRTEIEKKALIELYIDFSSVIYSIVSDWSHVIKERRVPPSVDMVNAYSSLSFMQKDLERSTWRFLEIYIDYYMDYLRPQARKNNKQKDGE